MKKTLSISTSTLQTGLYKIRQDITDNLVPFGCSNNHLFDKNEIHNLGKSEEFCHIYNCPLCGESVENPMYAGLEPSVLPNCSDGFDPLDYLTVIIDKYLKEAQKSIDNELSETAILDYVMDVFIPAIDQVDSRDFNGLTGNELKKEVNRLTSFLVKNHFIERTNFIVSIAEEGCSEHLKANVNIDTNDLKQIIRYLEVKLGLCVYNHYNKYKENFITHAMRAIMHQINNS